MLANEQARRCAREAGICPDGGISEVAPGEMIQQFDELFDVFETRMKAPLASEPVWRIPYMRHAARKLVSLGAELSNQMIAMEEDP